MKTTSIKLQPEVEKKLNQLIEIGFYKNKSQAINDMLFNFMIKPEHFEKCLKEFELWNKGVLHHANRKQ